MSNEELMKAYKSGEKPAATAAMDGADGVTCACDAALKKPQTLEQHLKQYHGGKMPKGKCKFIKQWEANHPESTAKGDAKTDAAAKNKKGYRAFAKKEGGAGELTAESIKAKVEKAMKGIPHKGIEVTLDQPEKGMVEMCVKGVSDYKVNEVLHDAGVVGDIIAAGGAFADRYSGHGGGCVAMQMPKAKKDEKKDGGAKGKVNKKDADEYLDAVKKDKGKKDAEAAAEIGKKIADAVAPYWNDKAKEAVKEELKGRSLEDLITDWVKEEQADGWKVSAEPGHFDWVKQRIAHFRGDYETGWWDSEKHPDGKDNPAAKGDKGGDDAPKKNDVSEKNIGNIIRKGIAIADKGEEGGIVCPGNCTIKAYGDGYNISYMKEADETLEEAYSSIAFVVNNVNAYLKKYGIEGGKLQDKENISEVAKQYFKQHPTAHVGEHISVSGGNGGAKKSDGKYAKKSDTDLINEAISVQEHRYMNAGWKDDIAEYEKELDKRKLWSPLDDKAKSALKSAYEGLGDGDKSSFKEALGVAGIKMDENGNFSDIDSPAYQRKGSLEGIMEQMSRKSADKKPSKGYEAVYNALGYANGASKSDGGAKPKGTSKEALQKFKDAKAELHELLDSNQITPEKLNELTAKVNAAMKEYEELADAEAAAKYKND